MKTAAALLCAGALIFGGPGHVLADGPKPFPDFQAKRIKPPSKSTKKRITVQITKPLVPQVSAAAPSAVNISPGAKVSDYEWFWDKISPDFAATGPGRLEPALNTLSTPPTGKSVSAPRLQALQNIAKSYGRDILLASVGTSVSPALALAVIAVESGGKVEAVSGAGATGLMQLMPATASRFGVTDSLDAADNIKGGIAFLDFLMTKFDGDPILVLAGYNAGENSIANHDGVPPFRETRNYVPKVLAAFSVAKGLCLTPPQLVSDGCVFQISSR